MKTVELLTIALAATVLSGCAIGTTADEPVTVTPSAAASAAPSALPSTAQVTAPAAAAPAPAKPPGKSQSSIPHIDAAAFLNALVESGCQIDKAEYKEVNRGGAIKIVCSKSVDPLNVELDDL